MDEQWRAVVGFEGLYEVSDAGRVRRDGRVLKLQRHRDGYAQVSLWRNGVVKTAKVHRLVAAAFLGPLPAGVVVNHLDGVKAHNDHANLERTTSSENNRHAFQTGLKHARVPKKPRVLISCGCGCGAEFVNPTQRGRDRRFVPGHGRRQLPPQTIETVRARVASGEPQLYVARELGLSTSTVNAIVKGKSYPVDELDTMLRGNA